MPKLINKPPKYSPHKPSGQAKVRSGGRTIYLGKYGSPESKKAYARFIADLPKQEEPAKLAEPIHGASLLVGEIVLRYYQHAQAYYVRDGVPTGEHVTIRACLRFLTNRYRELPASEFGPKKLKIVRDDMIKANESRRYINKAIGIVKRCFTWAASEELVSGSVAMALKTVQGLQKNRTDAREKDPVGPVADEDVDAVLPHVSDVVADVLRTMRLTGAQPGEVLAMKDRVQHGKLLTLSDCRFGVSEAHQRGRRHQVMEPVFMVAFAVESMGGTFVSTGAVASRSVGAKVQQQGPAPQS